MSGRDERGGEQDRKQSNEVGQGWNGAPHRPSLASVRRGYTSLSATPASPEA
jgi:hypothetical protein